jgi:hypothetical protein
MRRQPTPPAEFYAVTRESILFNPWGERRSTWEVVVGVPHEWMSGSHLSTMEQLIALHADKFRDFDWRELWNFVNKTNKRDKIPPFGESPYWVTWRSYTAPISILAFWPVSSRLRLSGELETDDQHLGWLRADPDPDVRRVASR